MNPKPLPPDWLSIGWLTLAVLLTLVGLGAFALSQTVPLTCANNPLQSCPFPSSIDQPH